jgi:hypothetical protein
LEVAGEGFAWHWSVVVSEWVRIPILKLEPLWEPKPGDIVFGECFTPESRRRKVDNWGKWREGVAA